MSVQWQALHMLQREPGPALKVDAGVVEPSDAGMLQGRKNVALARQAFGQAPGPAQPRQLQRHLPLVGAVGSLGQPDAAHAAFAKLTQQPPGADELACESAGERAVLQFRQPMSIDLGQRAHEGAGLQAGLHRQQRRQCAAQRRVTVRQRRQPGPALGGGQIQCFVEQLVDGRPVARRGQQSHRQWQHFMGRAA
jgi:hypothetical protein